jgi:hypothetical protein
MKWMEKRMWKKLRMSTLNVRLDGNCEESEAERDDRNGEESKTGEHEQRLVTSRRKHNKFYVKYVF